MNTTHDGDQDDELVVHQCADHPAGPYSRAELGECWPTDPELEYGSIRSGWTDQLPDRGTAENGGMHP